MLRDGAWGPCSPVRSHISIIFGSLTIQIMYYERKLSHRINNMIGLGVELGYRNVGEMSSGCFQRDYNGAQEISE